MARAGLGRVPRPGAQWRNIRHRRDGPNRATLRGTCSPSCRSDHLHRPQPQARCGAGVNAVYVELMELLRRADVVSLHAPATPETIGLIGPRELDAMKPTAILINTARGSLVDSLALANALGGGSDRGRRLGRLRARARRTGRAASCPSLRPASPHRFRDHPCAGRDGRPRRRQRARRITRRRSTEPRRVASARGLVVPTR